MTDAPSSGALPEAPASSVNSRAQRRQNLGWLVIVTILGIGAAVVVWNMVFASPTKSRTNPEDQAKISATADVARPADRSDAENAQDLKVALGQTEKDLQTAQGRAVTAEQKIALLEQQLAADRKNATFTQDQLVAELNRRTGSPPPGPNGGPQLAAAAPMTGASTVPAIGAGAAGPDAAPPVRPRRVMSVVRAPEPTPAPEEPTPIAATQPASAQGGKAAQAPTQYVTGGAQIVDTSTHVPPNAYARAKVLVGVDATTGVSGGADPKPVLFRILGPATHVGADGRFETTDLNGCLVNGAAFAELSSEKVYIKLQRISCPAGKGKVAVATVEGYASHKGKAGVRGQVISREGGLARRAMIAGTLQGLGQSLSKYTEQLSSTFSVSPGGGLGTPKALDPEQVAGGAAGSGVAGASQMLADYYIKRAEQYQPVIEMPTGVEIELVFLSGFQVKAAR